MSVDATCYDIVTNVPIRIGPSGWEDTVGCEPLSRGVCWCVLDQVQMWQHPNITQEECQELCGGQWAPDWSPTQCPPVAPSESPGGACHSTTTVKWYCVPDSQTECNPEVEGGELIDEDPICHQDSEACYRCNWVPGCDSEFCQEEKFCSISSGYTPDCGSGKKKVITTHIHKEFQGANTFCGVSCCKNENAQGNFDPTCNQIDYVGSRVDDLAVNLAAQTCEDSFGDTLPRLSYAGYPCDYKFGICNAVNCCLTWPATGPISTGRLCETRRGNQCFGYQAGIVGSPTPGFEPDCDECNRACLLPDGRCLHRVTREGCDALSGEYKTCPVDCRNEC